MFLVVFLVRPTRFERATYRVGVCHSIQLSYERISIFLIDYSKSLCFCKEKKLKFLVGGCRVVNDG